jgi:isopenicillin-N N-acyltransferase-like protein
MQSRINRRRFLASALTAVTAPTLVSAEKEPAFPLTVISGKPRERGRQYGKQFKEAIASFLKKEIYSAFVKPKHPTRDEMLRYAGACAREIKSYAPLIHDEMEGMAEGSELSIEQLTLITLHEELWHRGVLPKVPHCTAVAVGPAPGKPGSTYIGQTWDWMESVRNLSRMLLWKRPEGPALLAYAFPGLWVGAGMNTSGVALVWTSAGKGNPRVGIPSYVLIAQMLYQDSLKEALQEAKRAKNAGFFTFALADGEGRLANVEGSPAELAIEETTGRLIRHNFGSRKMTGTPADRAAPMNARCKRVQQLLDAHKSPSTRDALETVFADREVGRAALDVMIFDTTKREANLSRGPGHKVRYTRFDFKSG